MLYQSSSNGKSEDANAMNLCNIVGLKLIRV